MHWIDPASLFETRGKVVHFLLNPAGVLDGLILSRKRVVHFPPHMAGLVARNIAIGDAVRIRGVKPKGAPVLAAVSLTGPNGRELIDEGPDHAGHKDNPLPVKKLKVVNGTVSYALHGPKGELRGAFLDSRISIRMPPHAAKELANYLAPGAHVQAKGMSVQNRFGTVVDVEEISFLV